MENMIKEHLLSSKVVSVTPYLLVYVYSMLRKVWRCQKGKADSINLKRSRQYKWRKEKRNDNDLQNTKQRTKNWETRTPFKIGAELRCPGRVRRLNITAFCSMHCVGGEDMTACFYEIF